MDAGIERPATDRWESQIRRALLIAHSVPALFGLIAVVVAVEEGQRTLDIVAWSVVVLWCGTLLLIGWGHVGSGVRLGRWIIADAVVMAGLMFVGTSVRTVVHYVAIDGALYAAAFVSTRLGLTHLAIVFGGLGLGAVTLAAGSELPTPLVGWVLPLVLPTLGVIAFGFLRSGLNHMRMIIRERDRALEERRRLTEDVAARGAILSGLGAINETVGPAMSEIDLLVETYASLSEGVPDADAEVDWLRLCMERATADLDGLRETLTDAVEGETLAEAIDTGVLGASVVHILALDVDRNVDDPLARRLDGPVSAAIAGFVREGVSNAVTHGSPPVGVVARWRDPGTFEVAVTDCGDGPKPWHITGSYGLGMSTLRDYGSAVDGRVEHRRRAPGYAVVLIGSADGRRVVTADIPPSRHATSGDA